MLTGAIVVLGAQQGEQQRPGLSAQGVAVWPDDLSRELLAGGELEPLVADRHVVGITTNPAIFASALSAGDRRDNLYVKIPVTREGLSAITQAVSEGISVNVTLIFFLDRYRAVMEAYLAGLEGAAAAGQDLSTIRSVASFFVLRLPRRAAARAERAPPGDRRRAARCRGNRSEISGVLIDSSSIIPRLALNKASRRRYPVSLDQVSHAAGTRAGLAETAELAAAGKRA